MGKTSRHVRAFCERHTESGETVVASAIGYIGKMMGKGKDRQYNGTLIVSDNRVAFYRQGIFGEILETMPLARITSVERKSSLGRRVIRLHTSHDALEFKTFDKNAESDLVKAIESGRAAYTTQQSDAPSNDDPMGKLKELGELKESGVITQEDFDEKKALILSEI